MKTTKIINYLVIEPTDPAYSKVARRYSKHVDRENRKAAKFHARTGILRKVFGFI